jgi:hypothetical protein
VIIPGILEGMKKAGHALMCLSKASSRECKYIYQHDNWSVFVYLRCCLLVHTGTSFVLYASLYAKTRVSRKAPHSEVSLSFTQLSIYVTIIIYLSLKVTAQQLMGISACS